MYSTRMLALAAAIAASAVALAPLHEHLGSSARIVPGKFIVKMKDDVSQAASNEVESLMGSVDYVYNVTPFKAFTGRLSLAALDSLREHPGVDYIEREQVILASSYVSQHGAPWGLGRISHKNPGSFTDNTTYVYEGSAGEGVCAYVLDTGIRVDHEEFGGRAESLVNFSDDGMGDEISHGTHIAGTIGGATYGVAKKVSLYSVRTGHGYEDYRDETMLSNVLKGMEFVANDSQTRHCPNGTVANISWATPRSRTVNDLAKALLNAGVFVVVAAGNYQENVDRISPASEPSLCTVGATDSNNRMAKWSNYGSIVDILAPGVDILSASSESISGSALNNGTSMAAPHIAGLAACILASKHVDPKTLCDYMVKIASPVGIDLEENTVNLVAFNGNPEG